MVKYNNKNCERFICYNGINFFITKFTLRQFFFGPSLDTLAHEIYSREPT